MFTRLVSVSGGTFASFSLCGRQEIRELAQAPPRLVVDRIDSYAAGRVDAELRAPNNDSVTLADFRAV